MRQTFTPEGGPKVGRRNLARLRRQLARLKLDAFYLPHEDEYQNEYLPACAERLAWATGFTGSAGAAYLATDRAVVFADGRYTRQAASQLDPTLFEIVAIPDPGPYGWLEAQTLTGQRVGYDPRLMSPDSVEKLTKALAATGAIAVAARDNPVDLAWDDRPPEPTAKVVPHGLDLAGESSEAKRERLGKALGERKVDAVVLTSPASLAWLFNIRGGDVARTPLPLGRAILRADGTADLFLKPEKTGPDLIGHLGNGVSLRREEDLEPALTELKAKRVSLDPALASAWFFDAVTHAGGHVVRETDPCTLPRACKNAVEIEGARQAHSRDGAALARYLHWLATEGQSGKVREIEAVIRLEDFRMEHPLIRDFSFDSISGAGPNGAIVHYRVNTDTDRKLKRGSLFLIDSGGQYPDGTTDVTRTVAIGKPTPEMRARYTEVLKGHIALSVVRFPVGTLGVQLDVLARHALWQAGFDYDHGTGHGVGSYLGVHEGPQRIAKTLVNQPLLAGMILSNEPGYYRTGAYGIRIENLQVVTPPAPIPGGEREMLGFETLTLAPLERALIDRKRLTVAERAWVDAYHARVLAVVGPQVPADVRGWLADACAAL
jgi:Xaa-Pro aminopeptidase